MAEPAQESGPLVLALDIGTSSVRAIVYDSAARAVDGVRAQRALNLRSDADGAATLDADLVIDTLAECIDQAIQACGLSAERLAAVGCCTMWHSMVGLDSAGRAITPLYTWADTRGAASANEIQQELDAADIHRRTGCALHPSYFPARLRWLRNADPGLFGKVNCWVSPGEYAYRRFFGDAGVSISMASGTGLFDQNRQRWDPQMLAVSGIDAERLSILCDVDNTTAGLKEPWAGRWPSLGEVPWVPAIGDGAASNLGSGCAAADAVAINLGTSGAIRIVLEAEKVVIPPELWCYRLDGHRFVIGAAFSDGGEVYSWMRKTLRLTETDEELDRTLRKRAAGSHGLTFLPFLAGERSPGWRPDARATLHGISLATKPLDILQASMEGVALRFLPVWEILRARYPQVSRVAASGGAIGASRAWQQMIASALGTPLIVTGDAEASSRGAAILALKAAGVIREVTDVPAVESHVVEPDAGSLVAFQEALRRQQDLYERISE